MDAQIPARQFPDWTMRFEHVDDEDLMEDLLRSTPSSTRTSSPTPSSRRRCSRCTPRIACGGRRAAGRGERQHDGKPGSRGRPVLARRHHGILRGVDEGFARLLGLSPVEISNRSLLELVHPELRRSCSKAGSSCATAASSTAVGHPAPARHRAVVGLRPGHHRVPSAALADAQVARAPRTHRGARDGGDMGPRRQARLAHTMRPLGAVPLSLRRVTPSASINPICA